MKNISLTFLLIFTINGMAICQDNKLLDGYFKLNKSDTIIIIPNNKHARLKAGSQNPNDLEITFKTDTFVSKKYKFFDSIEKMRELDKVTINCIDWWLSVPVESQVILRKEIKDFINDYGLVSLPINNTLFNRISRDSENTELLRFVYTCGIEKYLIINSHENDDWKLQNAGLIALNEFFVTNKQLKKPSAVLEYLQLRDQQQIENWIKEKMEI